MEFFMLREASTWNPVEFAVCIHRPPRGYSVVFRISGIFVLTNLALPTPDIFIIMTLCGYNKLINLSDPILHPIFTLADPIRLAGTKRWNDGWELEKKWGGKKSRVCSSSSASSFWPMQASEINESDTKYEISMDLPGVKLADLSVTVDQSGRHPVIQIAGSRRRMVAESKKGTANENEEASAKDTEPEMSVAKFEKRFMIEDANADFEKMTANLSHGVLVVSVPKKAKATKPKIVIDITEEKAPDSQDLGFVDLAKENTSVETVDDKNE
jgi:HSP20 family molecular chaperone IbpA